MKKFIYYLSFVLLLSASVIFNSCEIEPGPISVENNLSPTLLTHGSYINWEIKVTNLGRGEVEIERIHCKEEFISGEFAGQYVELDLSLSNRFIEGNATEIAYSQSSMVINTSTTSATVKTTITVYSDGGDDTDETTYLIFASNKKKGGISCEVQSCLLNKKIRRLK